MNGHIFAGILTRIARAILVKTPPEMCRITRIAMPRCKVSLALENFPQFVPPLLSFEAAGKFIRACNKQIFSAFKFALLHDLIIQLEDYTLYHIHAAVSIIISDSIVIKKKKKWPPNRFRLDGKTRLGKFQRKSATRMEKKTYVDIQRV